QRKSSTIYAREGEKKNKRYKSSDSSSFNTKESGEGSINLNTTVGDEEDEVEEVCRPRQAKRKTKAGSAASSSSSFDVEALAKMMANEYVMSSDSYNTQKNQEMSELLQIKKQELELKAAELEIQRMENRQRDKALYETTTDEELKARLRDAGVCRFDQGSVTTVLSACDGCEFANVVKMVHGLVVLYGYEPETTVVNALITTYFGSWCFREGRRVFVEIGDRNVVTWTIMISGPSFVKRAVMEGCQIHGLMDTYCECGGMREAWQIFDSAQALKEILI
ncbi:pentatricopeptide repeat-containing protein, partial [Tanacetum coccineum]